MSRQKVDEVAGLSMPEIKQKNWRQHITTYDKQPIINQEESATPQKSNARITTYHQQIVDKVA